MALSLTLACLWGLLANVLAMLPSKDNYWTRAYGLIVLGVPILIYVFWQHGIGLALVVLLAASWLLRWPVVYLFRWLRARIG